MSLRNASTERANQRELDRQHREMLNPDPLHAAVLRELRKFERLGNTVTHDSSPLLLTQQGPDTTWASSKHSWPPGNVANPEGAQDIASPARAALDGYGVSRG